MAAHIPTPQISHFNEEDYEHIYEPAEDSFILLDALEEDAGVIKDLRPSLCLEVGSGSGIVSTFLAQLLGGIQTLSLCTDINDKASSATLRTAKANSVSLDPIRCDLTTPLLDRLKGKVDILLFNPPYVPTTQDELQATQALRGIGGSWAGGDDGMIVTNILLDQVASLLSPLGRFYLVAIEQNRPTDIIARLAGQGVHGKIVLRRRAGRELLSVLCFTLRSYPEPQSQSQSS